MAASEVEYDEPLAKVRWNQYLLSMPSIAGIERSALRPTLASRIQPNAGSDFETIVDRWEQFHDAMRPCWVGAGGTRPSLPPGSRYDPVTCQSTVGGAVCDDALAPSDETSFATSASGIPEVVVVLHEGNKYYLVACCGDGKAIRLLKERCRKTRDGAPVAHSPGDVLACLKTVVDVGPCEEFPSGGTTWALQELHPLLYYHYLKEVTGSGAAGTVEVDGGRTAGGDARYLVGSDVTKIPRDRLDAAGWLALADQLGDAQGQQEGSTAADAVVSGTAGELADKQRHCIVQALKIDENNSEAWNMLGASLDGDGGEYNLALISTATVTQQQCYAKAVGLDKSNYVYWMNLAATIPDGSTLLLDDGEAVTRVACFVKAVGLAPSALPPWICLASTMLTDEAVTLNDGRVVKPMEAWAETVVINPLYSDGWSRMSAYLPGEETYTLRSGRVVTAVDCLLQAVHGNPEKASAWTSLGARCASDATITLINGTRVTPLDCHARAVSCDPSVAGAWFNLGACLKEGQTTKLHSGDTVSATDCYLHGIDVDPDAIEPWLQLLLSPALGLCDAPGSKANPRLVTPGGREVTRFDCALRLVDLEPEKKTSWQRLAASLDLGREPTARIQLLNGSSITVEEILTKAGTLHPHLLSAIKNFSE